MISRKMMTKICAESRKKIFVHFLHANFVMFFYYLNNICYSICSKSKKSSSRELMLFTMHITRGDHTKHVILLITNHTGFLVQFGIIPN